VARWRRRLRRILKRLRAVAAGAAPLDALGRRLQGPRQRFAVLRRYGAFRRSPVRSLQHLVGGREIDNFTYDISNRDELAQFLTASIGTTVEQALAYMAELDFDAELSAEMAGQLAGRSDRNPVMPFGRRLGWYAIVRVRRPALVVETGVHDGLGSIAILSALERNAREGHPGELLSFDINPLAGWLVPPRLRTRYRIVIGNSVSALPEAVGNRSIDLFVHDSDHRYEHERAEYEAAVGRASPGVILLSDNAHASTALRDFAEARDLAFAFWPERPLRHFYPGGGIGIASPRRRPGRR
jgi:predicted O-methyltransferase YrrM